MRRQNSGCVLRNCLHTNWNLRTRALATGPSRINGFGRPKPASRLMLGGANAVVVLSTMGT
jgi:hypothetical protein